MAGCCCSGSFLGSLAGGRRPSSGFGRHPSDPGGEKSYSVSERTKPQWPTCVCSVIWCQNKDDKSDDVIWHQLSGQNIKPVLPRTPQTAGSWSRPAVWSGATRSGRIWWDWTWRQRTNTLTEPSCVLKVLWSVTVNEEILTWWPDGCCNRNRETFSSYWSCDTNDRLFQV